MDLFKNKNLYFLLASIFLINFIFKLIFISSPSLWYDEIISVEDTQLDFGHIKHEAEWDKNPPFYHYVLWVWSKIFGISEFAVRSMSAFFSSLTAVLIFVFANKVFDKKLAWVLVIIFSLHPYLYYFAQEARCYSFLIFLITTNLLLMYSLIQQPNYRKAFGLGVLNFLIFYTHYIAGLFILCQFIYLFIVFRRKIVYLLFLYLTPILLILLRFTKKQYNVLFFSNEMSRQKKNVPLAKINNLLDAIPHLYISLFVLIIFLIFLTVFLLRIKHSSHYASKPDLQFKIFILLTPLACILLLFGVGTWTNVFHERYLIFTIPLIIISFFVFAENAVLLYQVAIIIICFEVINLKFGESKYMDYKYSAVLAKELQKKNEINILIQTHDVIGLFIYYYDRNLFISKGWANKELLANENIYFFDTIEELNAIKFKNLKPVLFLQTFNKPEEEGDIAKYFTGNKYKTYFINGIEGVKGRYLYPIHY